MNDLGHTPLHNRRDFLKISGIIGFQGNMMTFMKNSAAPLRENKKNGNALCVFSKHLQWLNYTEMAETAADIGFTGVDLTVRPGGHVVPERVEEDLPKAVDAVKKAGLSVSMITTSINDAEDPLSEIILRTASSLDIRLYRMGYYRYDEKKEINENLKLYQINLKELAALNQQYNIRGAYQNHAGNYFGASIWDLWLILKTLSSEWIGCQYDIRHATVEGGNTWPLECRLISPFINSLDIKDFHWAKKGGIWKAENVPLGKGMVNFDSFFSLLNTFNCQVPFSFHFEYPLGGAEHGVRYLSIEPSVVIQAIKTDLDYFKRIYWK